MRETTCHDGMNDSAGRAKTDKRVAGWKTSREWDNVPIGLLSLVSNKIILEKITNRKSLTLKQRNV